MNSRTTFRLLKDPKYALFRQLYIQESKYHNEHFALQIERMQGKPVDVPYFAKTALPHKDMDEQEYKKYFTRYAAKENWLCLDGKTITACYANRGESR